MSIRRQLAIGIGLLMIVIMGGNFIINVKQLVAHYEAQLQARADETATTLALSMTQSAERYDDASLRSMVDVIFDRGQFKQVRFDYVDSDKFVARYAPEEDVHDVPYWFQSVIDMQAGYAQEQVSKGWQQLGILSVKMHTAPMYQQLWIMFKAELAWFAIMGLIVVYGIRLLLNWQLQPLQDILVLVDKLARNQFVHIHKQPKSKELVDLVSAMNRLSDRLNASFVAHSETVGRLQQANFDDALTQLKNRRGWEQFLQEWMTENSFRPGWAMLIRIDNLQSLNSEFGQTKVDELLLQIAIFLKTHGSLNQEHVSIARTGGGEFWIFCPDPLDKQFTKHISELVESLTRLSFVEQFCAEIYAAALPVQSVIAPASLKHQLDLLFNRARTEHKTLLIGEMTDHTFTNWVHWQKALVEALNGQHLQLYRQPLFNIEGEIIQYELHSRLKMDDRVMAAGEFWPLVERLKMTREFDERVIELFIKQFDKWQSVDTWVINISGASINQFSFRAWVEETLTADLRKKIMLEFSEYTLANLSGGAENWLHKMADQGLRISVDHLGTSGRNFSFLSRFPITQGKIQRRYIHNINQHTEHRFFVTGMIQILHGQKALCLAEGVETHAEKSMLIELGIDGVMGYGLAEPEHWR
ncbi:EAL domain-containing protein [Bermanella marisrubri]|uniref:EAL domain protein n=1 Tax=Bermanella marisrubri TaxID=207949 RepID=Q1N3J5_9GAMM|nr:EAL domain-containing protein [Bermanella marisrubri]EAT12879.1 EAL domain protein [Oceanobacter sp. RED65] [Bermanella marisrubri]QIZ83199.1 EAL domain-containing protein [Bermanella marisrubri]